MSVTFSKAIIKSTKPHSISTIAKDSNSDTSNSNTASNEDESY